MKTVAIGAGIACLFALSAAAQPTSEYLDVYIVKVKPEKRADFDNVAKKIAEANRKSHGDTWIAYDTMYGENNTVQFVSARKDMAAVETGMTTFMKAMKETFGPTFESVFHDMDACTVSARSEIRRRRWDLSINPPQNDEDYTKYVGQAKYLRVAAVRIRPGHAGEYEDMEKMIKAAVEKTHPEARSAVTQSFLGQGGATFYIASLQPSLSGFERRTTTLKEILGDENFERYQKVMTEAVLGTETMIGRIRPELSNPPEEIVNVTRDFWTPKPVVPVMASRAKQKK